MARDPGWTKIRYAYVHGSMSYRELAENYNVSLRTLSEVAKKEKWVTKRLQFRDRVNARADARACKAEADQLERIRIAADRLGEKLEEIMRDEEQLYLHPAVLRKASGAEQQTEKKLKSINPQTLVALAKSMKDMTAVLRDLHGISTRAEERAEKLARERLNLERERLEMEKEKAGAELGDRGLEAKIDDLTREAAE